LTRKIGIGRAGVPPAPERSEQQLLAGCEVGPTTKVCPLCLLPEGVGEGAVEFGICRARADGKNLYCKNCIRTKVTASRRALKEYRAARKTRQLDLLEGNEERVARLVAHSRFLTPVDRVRKALRQGAVTQKEIRRQAGLGDDQVTDALAELLLWTREVETRVVDGERHYVLSNAKAAIVSSEPAEFLPERKPDVRAGFASITELMPSRITGERKAG
jgi:hypothetical protein